MQQRAFKAPPAVLFLAQVIHRDGTAEDAEEGRSGIASAGEQERRHCRQAENADGYGPGPGAQGIGDGPAPSALA